MRHSKIFWVAIAASLFAGVIGLAQQRAVIYIPYLLINPLLFFGITSIKIFEPVRRKLEIIGSIALLINIPGSLHLHSLPIQYDIPLHFAMGILIYLALSCVLPIILKNRPSALTLILIVFLGGVLLEGIQKISDLIFGTMLSFDVVQSNWADILLDILMNVLGAIAAIKFSKPASSQSEQAYRDRV